MINNENYYRNEKPVKINQSYFNEDMNQEKY